MNETITSLQTDGVAMMPYAPELRQLVEEAAVAWQEFCQLPTSEKMRLAQTSNAVGYELKDGTGPQADRKENFDITTSATDILDDIETQHDFITKATKVSAAMAGLAIDFAHQTETAYGIIHLTDRTRASTDQIFTRFLHYFGDRAAGDEIAAPHCDQSGFTFHLFETAGGCQRLDYASRSWIDMPVSPGKLAAFPAMQLQLLAGGELKALSHRVIATDETKQMGRFAMVCFVKLNQTPVYDKDTHGRLQEFAPGFNYDMPPAEFSQLFM